MSRRKKTVSTGIQSSILSPHTGGLNGRRVSEEAQVRRNHNGIAEARSANSLSEDAKEPPN